MHYFACLPFKIEQFSCINFQHWRTKKITNQTTPDITRVQKTNKKEIIATEIIQSNLCAQIITKSQRHESCCSGGKIII